MSDATTIPTTSASHLSEARSQRGLALLDRGLLLGIALVTCIVSLPRFHGIMLGSNEEDAGQTVLILADALAKAQQVDASLRVDGPHLAQWIAGKPSLTHRLRDLRVAPDRKSLLYHGYQFIVHTDEEGPMLLAWPRRLNRTGRWAYAQRSGSPGLRTQAWSQVGYPPRRPEAGAPYWQEH